MELSQKEFERAKKEIQTVAKDIQLPKIAPVTVENLELIEKSLSHVDKQMKKNWVTTHGRLFNVDNAEFKNVFFTDSIAKGHGNGFSYSFAPFDIQWQAQTQEELRKVEMSLAKALKGKQITPLKAKKIQDDLNKAMAELKAYSLTNAFTYLDATTTPGIYYFKDNAEDEDDVEKARASSKRRLAKGHAPSTTPQVFMRQRHEEDAERSETEERNTNQRRQTAGSLRSKMNVDSLKLIGLRERQALLAKDALVAYGTVRERTPLVATEGDYTLTVPRGTRVIPRAQAQAYSYVYGNGSTKKQGNSVFSHNECKSTQQHKCTETKSKKSDCDTDKKDQKSKNVIVNGRTYKVIIPEIKGEQMVLDIEIKQ
jgi:hypothetical protein